MKEYCCLPLDVQQEIQITIVTGLQIASILPPGLHIFMWFAMSGNPQRLIVGDGRCITMQVFCDQQASCIHGAVAATFQVPAHPAGVTDTGTMRTGKKWLPPPKTPQRRSGTGKVAHGPTKQLKVGMAKYRGYCTNKKG